MESAKYEMLDASLNSIQMYMDGDKLYACIVYRKDTDDGQIYMIFPKVSFDNSGLNGKQDGTTVLNILPTKNAYAYPDENGMVFYLFCDVRQLNDGAKNNL